MSEQTIGIRRMGQERWKYLDEANNCFVRGKYIQCRGFIDAFTETIKQGTPIEQNIKIEFDKIEQRRRKQHDDLEIQIKDIGYLEQEDYQSQGKRVINIDAIHDMKNICWMMAHKYGLFNE